jgi:hypothetical protein
MHEGEERRSKNEGTKTRRGQEGREKAKGWSLESNLVLCMRGRKEGAGTKARRGQERRGRKSVCLCLISSSSSNKASI